MENTNMTPIVPIMGTIEGFTGIKVEYSIDGITDRRYTYSAGTPCIINQISDRICGRLSEQPDGRFLHGYGAASADGPGTFFGVSVSYCTIPDYMFISRIFAWLYNFCPDEALITEDFREAYGPALGDHIFEKWRGYRMDITKMIGYFGYDYDKGQKFFDMIMKKVIQYEDRLKEEKTQRELSERAAPSALDGRKNDEPDDADDAGHVEPQGKAGAGSSRECKGHASCGCAASLDTPEADACAAP